MKLEFERKVNWKTINLIPQKEIDKLIQTSAWNNLLFYFGSKKKVVKVTYEW